MPISHTNSGKLKNSLKSNYQTSDNIYYVNFNQIETDGVPIVSNGNGSGISHPKINNFPK